ncbi:unnamed protein product [Mytilus edulis]|uniref:SEA domain-containing protein n=1 Tax=Mytilus edulis TaxID=6550 RepID=A0A8S3R6C0_MYTED|nr:unnamed protein product [Mytilus edulis]
MLEFIKILFCYLSSRNHNRRRHNPRSYNSRSYYKTSYHKEVTTQEVTTVKTTTPEVTTKVVTKSLFYCIHKDYSNTALNVSVPTTTYTPVSGELKVEVILTINVTPNDEINNENSAYYQELFNETFIVLTNYYSNSAATKDNFIKIVVYRISKGSLVVNHTVIMNSTSTTGQNNVAAATNNLVNGGATLTIDNQTAGASTVAIYAPGGNATVTTSTTICGTFNTLNTCPTGQECSIDGNGVPYCAPIESTVSVPTTTYTPVSGEIKVEVILTINVTPNDEINNENSAYYQELFNETFIVLTNYYSNSAASKDNFIKIVVYRISKGSLVVNHAVIMNSTSTTGQNQVTAATHNLVNGGATLTIDNETAGASTAEIFALGGHATVTTSTTLCGIFNTMNTCPTGQECSIDGNGVPYCAPIESTDNFPLIVGLGVGIPLFFIVLALIIVLCVYNSKRHKSNSLDDDDLNRTMPTHEGYFTGSIPSRFNSWNRPGDSAFHDRWDDESVDSERGAYDNEMFRGKDIYVYDNNKGGKPASFSDWDFMFKRFTG